MVYFFFSELVIFFRLIHLMFFLPNFPIAVETAIRKAFSYIVTLGTWNSNSKLLKT